MEKEIEFAVSGSFEQLSEFKQKAEELGWKYISEFVPFTEEDYSLNEEPKLLYFCDEGVWDCEELIHIINGFSLTDSVSQVIIFDLNSQQEQALMAIKHSFKKVKPTEMSEFLDFITNNYTIEDGDLINDENRVESKEEVITTFKTMYGRTRV